MTKGFLTLGVLLLVVVSASAQTTIPKNPFEIEFDSPDHALITEYEAGFFMAGGTVPTSTQSLGKPALNASGKVVAQLTSRPTALGQYELKVRAKAGTAFSEWGAGGATGDEAVPFERVLLRPVALRIAR
jgi:hypothetical protein